MKLLLDTRVFLWFISKDPPVARSHSGGDLRFEQRGLPQRCPHLLKGTTVAESLSTTSNP
jgi:hypothetical protein